MSTSSHAFPSTQMNIESQTLADDYDYSVCLLIHTINVICLW